MIKFRGVIFLLILFTFQAGVAQSRIKLSGIVLSAETSEPLNDVLIEVQQTGYFTYSDEDGHFFIENIPPGEYRVRFSALGFAAKTEYPVQIHADMPARLMVSLQPRPVSGDSVVVTAAGSEVAGTELRASVKVIPADKIRNLAELGLARVLQSVAGVQVASPQGDGSGSTIRIHSSRSGQVLVLLDGQRLNNPQTGEVDLGQIPLSQVEEIRIDLQGDAARYGGGAFAGVVDFRTKSSVAEKYLKTEAGVGSFGFAEASLAAGLRGNRFDLIAHYARNYSRQDFTYRYQGENFTRRNASFRNQNYFGKLKYRTGPYEAALLLTASAANRGLPSGYFNEYRDSGARMRQEQLNLLLSQKYFLSPDFFLELSLGQNRLQQNFNNENDPVVFTRYRNVQVNRTREADLRIHWKPDAQIFLNSGIRYLQEFLDHRNLLYPAQSIGAKQREIYSLYQRLEWNLPRLPDIWKRITLKPAFRFEKYFRKSGGYPSLNIAVVPDLLPRFSFYWGISKALRYPDFNSLFWGGDGQATGYTQARGNPDLKPEKKTTRSWGVQFQPKAWYLPSLNLYRFRESIGDLIYWQPGRNNIWQPRNLLSVEQQGWDLLLEQKIHPRFLELTAAYHRIRAENRSGDPVTDGKVLVFVPPYTLNLTLLGGFNSLHASLNYRAVGGRETVPANSRGTRLAAYDLWEASLGIRTGLKKFRFDISLHWKNLLNEDYQLIYGYPMPGRSWQIRMAVKRKM